MRLIDADALMEHLSNRYINEIFSDWRELPLDTREKFGLLGSTFKQAILNAPTIDAEPVRHGRWIDEIEPNAVTASGREVHIFRCSACDFTWANKTAVLHYFKFCPNCGAKMDGGAEDAQS